MCTFEDNASSRISDENSLVKHLSFLVRFFVSLKTIFLSSLPPTPPLCPSPTFYPSLVSLKGVLKRRDRVSRWWGWGGWGGRETFLHYVHV